MNITEKNLAEAIRYAEHLSRVTKRGVEHVLVYCKCDEDPLCPRCDGRGIYYEFHFSFCDHVVHEDPKEDDACNDNDCRHKEYLAFCERAEALEVG